MDNVLLHAINYSNKVKFKVINYVLINAMQMNFCTMTNHVDQLVIIDFFNRNHNLMIRFVSVLAKSQNLSSKMGAVLQLALQPRLFKLINLESSFVIINVTT